MVADPQQISRHSPETTGVRTSVGGPLPVGASFAGSNANGWFRWTTSCVVVESEPRRAFAFDVTFLGLAVSRWRYAVTPEPDGCIVEEQWWDHRGVLMKTIGAVGTGVRDRRAHNTRTMTDTLSALKAHLEGQTR